MNTIQEQIEEQKQYNPRSDENCDSTIIINHEIDARDRSLTECFWKPIESTLEDFQQSNKTFGATENDRFMIKRDPETLARTYRIMSGEITLVIRPHNISSQDVKKMMKFYAQISVSCSNGNKSKSAKSYTFNSRDAMNALFQQIEAVYNAALCN